MNGQSGWRKAVESGLAALPAQDGNFSISRCFAAAGIIEPMMDRDGIVQLILGVVAELNASLTHAVDISRGADTALFGGEAVLDSLGFVSLVVAVEQTLDEAGVSVILADERALSSRSSPFRTVGSLADYIMEHAAVPHE